MTKPNNDSAAFPCLERGGSGLELTDAGMTLRQYAAIKLRIPDSGIDWLDKMIVKSKRDDLAAQALQGMLADSDLQGAPMEFAERAYTLASAALRLGRYV